MPELIPVNLYSPLDPYHYLYDNLPIKELITNDQLISSACDNNTYVLQQAGGTQGNLSNRLNQSIDQDGSLQVTAIDNALHNIGFHMDGTYDGISYVRMMETERAKLSLISNDATNLSFNFQTPSNVVFFDSGTINFEPSTFISWEVTGPSNVTANLLFPTDVAHRHYYDVAPTPVNLLSPDYQHYQTNSVPTAFMDGSLRVTINGVRLTANASIYIPGNLVNDPWTLLTFTPDSDAGIFALSTAITSQDVIIIDFDVSLIG